MKDWRAGLVWVVAAGLFSGLPGVAGAAGEKTQAKKGGAAQAAYLFRLDSQTYRLADFEPYYARHGDQGKESRRSALEGFAQDRTLAVEARRLGYDKRRDVQARRAILAATELANKFVKKVIYPAIEVREDELAAGLPPSWEQIRLDLLLLPLDVDLHRVGELAEKAGSLEEVARALGVPAGGPGSHGSGTVRKTDFMFRNADYFSPKEMEHLFSLAKGKLGGVVQSALGPVVVAVADRRTFPEAEQRSLLVRVREGVHRAKLNAVYDEYLKQTDYQVHVEKINRIAQASSAAQSFARGADDVILTLEGTPYYFSDVWEGMHQGLFILYYQGGDIPAMMMREEVERVVLAHVFQREAAKFGVALSEAEQRDVEREGDLFAAKVLLREVFPAGVTDAGYGKLLTELKTKYGFQMAPEAELEKQGITATAAPRSKGSPMQHGR